MRYLLSLVLIAFYTTTVLAATPFPHNIIDEVLRSYVDSLGRVNYPALKAARAPLDAYVDSLGKYSPHSHPERYKIALCKFALSFFSPVCIRQLFSRKRSANSHEGDSDRPLVFLASLSIKI